MENQSGISRTTGKKVCATRSGRLVGSSLGGGGAIQLTTHLCSAAARGAESADHSIDIARRDPNYYTDGSPLRWFTAARLKSGKISESREAPTTKISGTQDSGARERDSALLRAIRSPPNYSIKSWFSRTAGPGSGPEVARARQKLKDAEKISESSGRRYGGRAVKEGETSVGCGWLIRGRAGLDCVVRVNFDRPRDLCQRDKYIVKSSVNRLWILFHLMLYDRDWLVLELSVLLRRHVELSGRWIDSD